MKRRKDVKDSPTVSVRKALKVFLAFGAARIILRVLRIQVLDRRVRSLFEGFLCHCN